MKELNVYQQRVYEYLKMCAKVEGNPVLRSIKQIAKEFDKGTTVTKEAINVLEANGQITRDTSNKVQPKIIVN